MIPRKLEIKAVEKMSQERVRFESRYVGIFTAYYIGFVFAIGVIAYLLNWEPPSSMGLILAMSAAMGAGQSFGKNKTRLPEKKEKRLFGVMGLVVLTLISLIYVAVLSQILPPEEIEAFRAQFAVISSPAWVGILLFVTVLHYFIVAYFFGFGAKIMLKALAKQQEKLDKAT